jgi:hypothetical protein
MYPDQLGLVLIVLAVVGFGVYVLVRTITG